MMIGYGLFNSASSSDDLEQTSIQVFSYSVSTEKERRAVPLRQLSLLSYLPKRD